MVYLDSRLYNVGVTLPRRARVVTRSRRGQGCALASYTNTPLPTSHHIRHDTVGGIMRQSA